MRFQHMTLRLVRSVSVFSCLGLGVLTAAAQQREGQQSSGQRQVSSSNVDSANAIAMAVPAELPESPGAVRAQQEAAPQQVQPPSSATAEPQSPTAQSPSQTVQSSQTTPQKPVGTAVAETSKASGVAASQPAGVAIAPAKQRRVRLIVIRVGAILGAGAAVGTVVALTQATSSKPPGAH